MHEALGFMQSGQPGFVLTGSRKVYVQRIRAKEVRNPYNCQQIVGLEMRTDITRI